MPGEHHLDGIHEQVSRLLTEFRSRRAPLTKTFIYLMAGVVLLQGLLSSWLQVPLAVSAALFFIEVPTLAWLLSPFLHVGVTHFLTNFLLVFVLGLAVEPTMERDRYLGFLVVAATGAAIGAYLSIAIFSTDPVAAYGASGVGYALAVYALTGFLRTQLARDDPVESVLTDGRPLEVFAALLGLAAVITLLMDAARGPLLRAGGVNGAHLGGALVGLAAALDLI